MSIKNKLLILFIPILIWGCQQKNDSNLNNNTNKANFPDQESWNSTLIATNKGQVTATIKYGHMTRFNKKRLVLFDEGIVVDFFDENGQHTSKLTSIKGKLDEKTNNVEAYDSVDVVSDSGITLITDKLWWDNAIEKIVTDQFVTITTVENDTLYGVGFESDQTLSNWMIKEPRGKTDKQIDLSFKKRKSLNSDSTQKEEIAE